MSEIVLKISIRLFLVRPYHVIDAEFPDLLGSACEWRVIHVVNCLNTKIEG